MTAMSMAELVKKHREALGESQTAFSRRLGTTVTTISRIESGNQVPGGKLAIRLAISGLPLDEINEAFELAESTRRSTRS